MDFFLPHWDSIFRNPIQPFSFLDAEMDTVVFPQDLVSRDLDWLIVFIPADCQHGHNLNLRVILFCSVVTNDTHKELKNLSHDFLVIQNKPVFPAPLFLPWHPSPLLYLWLASSERGQGNRLNGGNFGHCVNDLLTYYLPELGHIA